jgi:hypothetical protein
MGRVESATMSLDDFIAEHPTIAKVQLANALNGDLPKAQEFVRWTTQKERVGMGPLEKGVALDMLDLKVEMLMEAAMRVFSPLSDEEEARGRKIVTDHFPNMLQEIGPLVFSEGTHTFDYVGVHGTAAPLLRERIGLSTILAGMRPDAAKQFRVTAGHEVFHAVLARLEMRFGTDVIKSLYDAAQQDHIKQQIYASHGGEKNADYYKANPEEMLVEAYGLWLEGDLKLNDTSRLSTFFNRVWAVTVYLFGFLSGDRLLAEAFEATKRGEVNAMTGGAELTAEQVRQSAENRQKAGFLNYNLDGATPKEAFSRHNTAAGQEETLDTFGKEEQAHLTNEIEKILGKDVEVAFKGMKNTQGSWSKTKKRINLAITHDFVTSNAFHEAFHGAADLYLKEEQFKQLYKFFDRPSIKKQIREFLKDSPDAWEAARDDPRELMAYGYQMFHAGVLNMEPAYQGTIGKILQYLADKFRRVNAWLRMQDTDRGLLEKIKQGYFADGKASAVELALANDPRLRAQARRITAEAFKTLDKIYESAFYPYDKRLRDMGNPVVSKLAKILYTQVGEKRENRGLLQERPMQMKRFLNAYDALRQVGPDVFDRTLGEMAAGQAPGDAAMAKSIRDWLDGLHAYGVKAGVEMGYVKDYIPMSWSGEKVKANRAGFIAILERHMEDIAKLNAHLEKQNPHKKFVKLTPANIADLMEKRGTHTGEVLGTTYDAQGAPEAFHTLDRVFGFLNNEERRPFMHDNLNGELQNYVKRLVNRAEYVRHFGNASEGWDSMIAEAKEYGLTAAEEKLIHDYKDTIFGKKLADMNPTLRKIYGINTAYQNYRVLGASVMSNLIDPFGIAIRSGEWNDAWESYKLAISRMFKSGRDKTQGLENLAKMIGVMETAGAADSLSELYGGVNIEGKAKWWNDKLFQWNGMDGLTKSVRLAGVRGGIDFIKRHGPGQGVSKDHLAELGLRPGDVMVKDEQLAIMPEQFMADHGLTSADALVKSERIQRAINRFVDEAVLRPNAGERTYWGSLPELAPLYHLKQYMFSFNHVINKKLEHEAFERGDTTPYMMASTYVPIMAASTFVKDLILGGGSVPAGKTFTDYMLGGLGKSGLLGPVEMAEWGALGAASGDPMQVKQALGPTVSQAIEAMGALGAMGQKSMGGFMTESLPLGSILKHPL